MSFVRCTFPAGGTNEVEVSTASKKKNCPDKNTKIIQNKII